MEKKKKNKIERIVYIVLIAILVLFGILKDSEAAKVLIEALKNAFSIILI